MNHDHQRPASFIQSIIKFKILGGISYKHKHKHKHNYFFSPDKRKVGITEAIGIKMTDETDTKKRKMEDEPEAELGM